jgi:hypothetical protein
MVNRIEKPSRERRLLSGRLVAFDRRLGIGRVPALRATGYPGLLVDRSRRSTSSRAYAPRRLAQDWRPQNLEAVALLIIDRSAEVMATVAATNKSLAQNNKSSDGREATKERRPR